ncbi:MAG: glycosyltransferase [Patescibacteria group bacterium]|nr:glycosyltransferase [Patescibacteria group bacterium]
MSKRSILILHASVGQGHKTAALALEEVLRDRGVTVVVEDLLDYALPVFKSIYADSYLELAERAPDFMAMLYKLTDRADSGFRKELISIISRIGVPKFRGFGEGMYPDAIVHTHHLGMDLLKNTVTKIDPPIRNYCVVTDFAANSLWAHKEISRYFVAGELVKTMLVQRGISPEKIEVSGIPLRSVVRTGKQPETVRTRLGISKLPVITILGAGLRDSKVRVMLQQMIRNGFSGTILIVCGRNEDLTDSIKDVSGAANLDIFTYGHIDYIDDVMVASDIVVSKAGGLTVSEVLARGVPLIVVNGIRGQEEWNADFVCASGAGIQLHVSEMLPYAVNRILNDPERLNAMRSAALRIGNPDAAVRVAEGILRDLP